MAVLVFKLRYVPDIEAQEVREILAENNIEFFETSAGILGISMPGLWVKNNEDAARARLVIDEYQENRFRQARDNYEEAAGRRTMIDVFKDDPIRFVGALLVILLICYFMIFLFFNLG